MICHILCRVDEAAEDDRVESVLNQRLDHRLGLFEFCVTLGTEEGLCLGCKPAKALTGGAVGILVGVHAGSEVDGLDGLAVSSIKDYIAGTIFGLFFCQSLVQVKCTVAKSRGCGGGTGCDCPEQCQSRPPSNTFLLFGSCFIGDKLTRELVNLAEQCFVAFGEFVALFGILPFRKRCLGSEFLIELQNVGP